jgi:hypothetical protein
MPLNAATYADELAMKAGKPHSGMKGKDGKLRRGWKGFYGSVHDIVSLRDCRIVRLHECEGLGGLRPGPLLLVVLRQGPAQGRDLCGSRL